MKKKHIIIALGLVFTVGVSFSAGKTWSANKTSVSQLNPLEGQSFKLDIKLKEGAEKRGLSSANSMKLTKGEKLTHYLNCMLYNCSAEVGGRSQCIGSCEGSDGHDNVVIGIQVADYGTCMHACERDCASASDSITHCRTVTYSCGLFGMWTCEKEVCRVVISEACERACHESCHGE